MVLAAKEAGVTAIKLQTYTPDTMTLNLSKGEFSVGKKIVFGKGGIYMIYLKKHIHVGVAC